MLLQELFQLLLVAITHFAKHPPDGLVHQVVPVVHQTLGKLDDLLELVALNERKRRQHRHTPFPQHIASSKPIKHTTLIEMLHQPSPKDFWSGRVNDVPNIHRTKIRQVELNDLAAFKIAMRILRFRRDLILTNQNQHSGQPTLMPR